MSYLIKITLLKFLYINFYCGLSKYFFLFTPLEQALQERCSSDDDEDATATSTATGATASPTDMHEDE